jgi:hypothetical protein
MGAEQDDRLNPCAIQMANNVGERDLAAAQFGCVIEKQHANRSVHAAPAEHSAEAAVRAT